MTKEWRRDRRPPAAGHHHITIEHNNTKKLRHGRELLAARIYRFDLAMMTIIATLLLRGPQKSSPARFDISLHQTCFHAPRLTELFAYELPLAVYYREMRYAQ